MADGMLSLSWNNHSATFCHTLASLRAKERYTDVTVTCEGKFYPVHKLVLSTCSEYFENMFEHTPCKHPVVVLRDVKCDELEALLSYMYDGVVSVAQTDLPRLIKVAELLQIKGLAVPDEPPPKTSHVLQNSHKYSSDRNSQHLPRRSTQAPSSVSARNSPHPRSRPTHDSSDRGISPQPKRMRSEGDNTVSQDRIHTSSVSPRSKDSSHNTESDWQLEPTRTLTEQNLDLRTAAEIDRRKESSSQEAISSQGQTCDIQIKEEMMEDIKDSEADASDTGLDYASVSSDGGLPSISRGDHQDTANLMMMKLEQSNHGQQPDLQPLVRQDTYPEGMNTTLPGPSEIQGWFGAETMAGLSMGKGNGNDSQMFISDTSQQAHKRDMLEDKDDMVAGYSRGAMGTGKGQSSTLHQCHYCAYNTCRRYDLNKHIRIHTGEKPFSCVYCPASFAQNSALKAHLRMIHRVEQPLTCPHCKQTFSRKKVYQNHLRMHTELVCP